MSDIGGGCLRALVTALIPVILVVVGGGVAWLAVQVDLQFLFWIGLAIAAVGAVWIIGFILIHGPSDLIS